jgi:FAD/FMN-containing dehydrogenase
MSAGGYGSMSRKYGVLADNVVTVKVVDAQGRVLQADESVNPDLFFAVRGGGGGTYGIVVEATLKLVEVPVVALGHIKYSGLDTAVDLLDRCEGRSKLGGVGGGAGLLYVVALGHVSYSGLDTGVDLPDRCEGRIRTGRRGAGGGGGCDVVAFYHISGL